MESLRELPVEHRDSKFLGHGSCDKCGSSDGVGIYEDHEYCFVCRTYSEDERSDGSTTETAGLPATGSSKQKTLLQGEAEAIPGRGLRREICAKYGYLVGKHQGEACQIANYCDAAGNPVAQKRSNPVATGFAR